MFRILVASCVSGFLSAFSFVPAISAAESGSAAAVLSQAGQAVEVRGVRTHVIAFFERPDAAGATAMRLTVLLSGGAAGSEVLRTQLPLMDGQSHALTMAGGEDGAASERFRFTRSGNSVEVGFDELPVETPMADAGPQDPGEPTADVARTASPPDVASIEDHAPAAPVGAAPAGPASIVPPTPFPSADVHGRTGDADTRAEIAPDDLASPLIALAPPPRPLVARR